MKRVTVILMSIAILISSVYLGFSMTVSAGNSDSFSCSFETDAEVKARSGYYTGVSNANGYKESGDGYKYDNYNNLLKNAPNVIKNGHHMAIPVVNTGIGHNNSKGAMRLLYDANVTSTQVNPGFSLMDSADSKSHKPNKNTLYTISFYYKVEGIAAPSIISVGQRTGALSVVAFDNNYDTAKTRNVVDVVTISETTDDWVMATASYLGVGDSCNLVMYMVSSDKTNQAGTSVLIDDISITKAEASTLNFDSNGGTPIEALKGIPGSAVTYEAPLKANAKFAGWYSDPEFNTPAPTTFPAIETTLYAKWIDADTTVNVNESFENYDLGDNPPGLYASEAARVISDEHFHGRTGSKSLKFTNKGYQKLNDTPSWVVTGADGVPSIFESGHSYSITLYVWAPATKNYNLRISTVSSVWAESSCKRTKELERKLILQGEQWNKVTADINILGIDGYDVSYLAIGFSLVEATETDTYVFYMDDIKVVPEVTGDVSFFQDYEDFEAKTYTNTESNGIRGNGSGRTIGDEYNHTDAGSKSLKLNMNQTSNLNMARSVIQFDYDDFYIDSSRGYTISFWVCSDEALTSEIVLGVTASPTNFWQNSKWVEETISVNLEPGVWKEVVFHKADFSMSGYLTIAARHPAAVANPKPLYVDDVSITVHTALGKIHFNTNGGTSIKSRQFFPGQPIGSLPECERVGYIFEGWFDETLTTAYSSTSLTPSEGDMNLYALWSSFGDVPESIKTGFEKEEYAVTPYSNTDTGSTSTQLNMSAGAIWIPETQEYANHGSGVMKLVNDPFVKQDSETYQAVALMRSDGTRYSVLKGQRYKITYSFINDTPDSAHSYVSAVVSADTVLKGVGVSDQCLKKNTIHGVGSEWAVSEECFIAKENGFVYLTIAARSTTSEDSSRYHTVYIDDVSVEALGSDYTSITFMNETMLVNTSVGKCGELMDAPLLPKKEGYEFTGWYTDAECTAKYPSYTYADTDITLYAGYQKASAEGYLEKQPDKTTISFEETEFLRIFYNMRTHRSYRGDAMVDELELINNPATAHSGNWSIKMNPVDWYYFAQRFSLYNTANPYGMFVLEPGEEYKLTYYVLVDEDVNPEANIQVWLTDVDNIEADNDAAVGNSAISFYNLDEGEGPWIKVEQFVLNDTTSPKGIALGNKATNNGNCCYIDDITIMKVKPVTVRFSTGAAAMEPVTVRSGHTMDEPYVPYRDGYEFTGWYLDEDLKFLVNFDTMSVDDDMTLYAGWIKLAGYDSDSDFDADLLGGLDDLIDFDNKKSSVNNGKRPELLESDPVNGKLIKSNNANGKAEESDSFPLWLIIVLSAVAVAVVAGGTVFLILFFKKKKSEVKVNE